MRETMLGKREFTIKELFCSQTSLVKDDGVSSKQRRVESLCDAINEISIEKVLGINWNTFNDKLVYKNVLDIKNQEAGKATKRNVLSTINGIYDPLGLIAPITIKAKIII